MIRWLTSCLLAFAFWAAPESTVVLLAQEFPQGVMARMDQAVQQALANRECPGGVLQVGRDGQSFARAYGSKALVPEPEPNTPDTIYDAASLTKVLACLPAVMRLVEMGQLTLDAPVTPWIPEFLDHGKAAITLRHLLTHTSGLRPGIGTGGGWSGAEGAMTVIARESTRSTPGTAFVYSDLNFIVLGVLVHRVSGKTLDVYCAEHFFRPLKMTDTTFLPDPLLRNRIAPTQVVDGVPLRGIVHDPTARLMGGVAGHAGLFTTASDLARYAQMILNLGELDGMRVLSDTTVRRMTSVQTLPGSAARRGLGWDIDSDYSGPRGDRFPVGSFGHTGFTGTSLWIDPYSRTYVVFLSNRNHPTGQGSVSALRALLGTLAGEAAGLPARDL